MSFFTRLAATALFIFPTTNALAEQYCDAFNDPTSLAKKYARLVPMSDQNTGWIFTKDQLNQDYVLKDANVRLLKSIAEEFQKIDTKFAIVMAPPRPLDAGEDIVSKTVNGAIGYDLTATMQTFSAMIQQVNNIGITMPDLSALVTTQKDDTHKYFFKRDTHWTPFGAAQSVQALASSLGLSEKAMPPILENGYEERGSLSEMSRIVCDADIEPEVVAAIDYPSSEMGLLDDIPSDFKVALAGSSYSDRYKRDTYRVADAIAYFLSADVENISVSGGGAIGAIEGMISSGKLRNGDYDLVVWELPYTEGLNNESALRQLLGALRNQRPAGIKQHQVAVGQTLNLEGKIAPSDVLNVKNITDQERVTLKIQFTNRKPKKVRLVRKSRVPQDLRSGAWSVSLAGLPNVKSVEALAQ